MYIIFPNLPDHNYSGRGGRGVLTFEFLEVVCTAELVLFDSFLTLCHRVYLWYLSGHAYIWSWPHALRLSFTISSHGGFSLNSMAWNIDFEGGGFGIAFLSAWWCGYGGWLWLWLMKLGMEWQSWGWWRKFHRTNRGWHVNGTSILSTFIFIELVANISLCCANSQL